MKRVFLLMFLTGLGMGISIAQGTDVYEIQSNEKDSVARVEVARFYEKLHRWTQGLANDSLAEVPKPERMIKNFVLFSEDGLMMKDFRFHTVTSCKTQILSNLPETPLKNGEKDWIYITIESQVDQRQLVEMLKFFKEEHLDYHFGQEEVFIPLFIRK